MPTSAEQLRLEQARLGKLRWKRWGPYVSERQWGTVREDYSADGNAWDYFPHDMAAARAYRWGEDAIGGLCDHRQRLCIAPALWNERDPILKERLFGLTGPQGNHGEDVKEIYYYLDATPTASYLKMLYRYPQREFPYAQLVRENAARSRLQPEYEILDTGLFDDGRFFDLLIECAKVGPEDVLIQYSATNRGPDPAPLHLLPTVWFRNTWSWAPLPPGELRPQIHQHAPGTLAIAHSTLGNYFVYFQPRPGTKAAPELLFTENETNAPRLFNAPAPPGAAYFKDAFHQRVIHRRVDVTNPELAGTKAAAHYFQSVAPGETFQIRLRLSNAAVKNPFADFYATFQSRIAEADEFYRQFTPVLPPTSAAKEKGKAAGDAGKASESFGSGSADRRAVQRQALAGMIWSKQFYDYDVREWLAGDPLQPTPPRERLTGRNADWAHLNNADVISMPDKWEYPWYATWDLCFHCVPLAMTDPDFAKEQLVLFTREWYMAPSGQIPAYEWAFGDVNPPLQAWAAWRVFQIDRHLNGKPDRVFLERIFLKLLLNFTWWVNRKDLSGRNIFQGGFLGMDNIGVFDRSARLPTGGSIFQADATSWMAMYCLTLMRIALELALTNPVYQDMASKFFEHFLYIASAMTNVAGQGIDLWSEADGFFYDVLVMPDGQCVPLQARSMVGLIPLLAVEVLSPESLARVPEFTKRLEWFLNYRPDLARLVSRWHEPGGGQTHLLSLLRGHRMKCLLRRMLDPAEFLSPFGVRSLSRHHLDQPYRFKHNGDTLTVKYEPGESSTGVFGGNSNWRGPIWMPVNYLLIEALYKFHHYYGDDFQIPNPVGSGQTTTLAGAADDLTHRLASLFLRDATGHRPIYMQKPHLQHEATFREPLIFHEYFDGDTGRGLGASHQTGWTGLIGALLSPLHEQILKAEL
ncbi:MAG: glucosidase [Planctomycetota bacterium]|nr:glucosidase [Planctomycetota bacterium]